MGLISGGSMLSGPGREIAQSSAEINRFGFSIVLTGGWAPWGIPNKNGAVLAAKLSKHGIVLDVQDDRCEASAALTNLQKFTSNLGSKVNIFSCMDVLDAVAPLAKRMDGIILSAGGYTRAIHQRNSNVSNFYALEDNEVQYLIPYWRDIEKFKSVAIVRGDWAYGEAFGVAMENAVVSAGMRVTSHDAVSGDLTALRSVFVRMIANAPDVVFINQAPAILGVAIKQLRSLGYHGAIYSGFYAELKEVLENAGSSMEGVRYSYYSDDNGDPVQYAEFRKQFQEQFGEEPNHDAAIGFDLVKRLDIALDHCRADQAECIQREMRSLASYRGVSGSLTINEDGTANREFGIKEFKDGATHWLEQFVKPSTPQ